jgi:outer membrane immunogenic protein
MRNAIHTALTFAKAGAAAVAVLAATSFANAADLQRPVYKAQPYAPIYSWQGAYIGIVGGGSFGDLSGYNVGATLGYNWQIGSWVYGIEGDLSYTSNDETITGVKFTQDYLATVRGRLGYTWTERLLIFGTGGYAGANTKATIGALSSEKFLNGWTLGAGVEYAMLPRWTVKAEYLYVDYGSETYFPGTVSSRNVSLTDSIFRVGLNYKF